MDSGGSYATWHTGASVTGQRAAAPTARIAALSTSIRPAERARSTAGFPFPSRRNVDSLIAFARERFETIATPPVKMARWNARTAWEPSGPVPLRTVSSAQGVTSSSSAQR